MASSSLKKRIVPEQSSNNHGVLENWFAGDVEAMTTFMHEMSRKHINILKVLEISWLKRENLEEPRVVLKHLLEMTENIYPDLIKVFYTNTTLGGQNLVSYVMGVKLPFQIMYVAT